MNSTNFMRLTIVVLLVAVAVTSIITYLSRSTSANNPNVMSGGIACLSAVCISDEKFGITCQETSPSMAQIILSSDLNEPGASRVTITYNSNLCR